LPLLSDDLLRSRSSSSVSGGAGQRGERAKFAPARRAILRLMWAVLTVVAVSMVVAFVVGQWWVVICPLFVVPTYYLGLERGWWGNGLGDGWPYVMLFGLALAIGSATVGLAARLLIRKSPS
jgi:hypothetical protein